MKHTLTCIALALFIVVMAENALSVEKETLSGSPFLVKEEITGEISLAKTNLHPAVVGSWGGPYEWPVIAIHSFLLPTGKVLQYSLPAQVPDAIYLWNPQNWEFTQAPVGRPLFCSGHSLLADGRILVTGGNGPAPEGEFRGLRDANIYDPFTETWTRADDMADGRWYPTNVTLADGRVLVLSGLDELTGNVNEDFEIFDPSTGSWQIVKQTFLPLFPRTCVLTTGDIFYSGPSRETGHLDVNAWQWYDVRLNNFGNRYDGLSVLLPPGPDKVMIIGGRDDFLVTETAEIIDLNDSVPAWSFTTPMNFPRMHGNVVILPDATVMIVGGHSRMHSPDDTLTPRITVYEPEIFNPLTETWSVMAPMTRPREYHSTALLLPDARVLLAGSNNEFTAEIFSPPYLFLGPRPVIELAPAEVMYGDTFNVKFTSETEANIICLIRLSSVTHSVNMDQRYVHIADVDGNFNVAVQAPSGGTYAPPGYYMLFVVSADGVPSVANMIRLDDEVASCCSFPGDADGNGDVNIGDATFLVTYIFQDGDAPPCLDEADSDGSNDITIGDATYIVKFVFQSGEIPECGTTGL